MATASMRVIGTGIGAGSTTTTVGIATATAIIATVAAKAPPLRPGMAYRRNTSKALWLRRCFRDAEPGVCVPPVAVFLIQQMYRSEAQSAYEKL
jgi:hypothetical protein